MSQSMFRGSVDFLKYETCNPFWYAPQSNVARTTASTSKFITRKNFKSLGIGSLYEK